LYYFSTVTAVSSIMNVTHALKWVWNYSWSWTIMYEVYNFKYCTGGKIHGNYNSL